MTALCDCGATLGPRNETGRCRSCVAKRRYSDPAERAKMSTAKKIAMADPVKRARVVAAAKENAIRRRASLGDRRISWCPLALRDEYQRLRRNKKMGAADARRIIEEQIAGTRAHALREIAQSHLAMQLRAEREKAQAY